MDVHAGIKISPDEYFARQKDAEVVCKKKIKHLIIQSIICLACAFFFLLMKEWISEFFIVWYLFVFISLFMAFGSLIAIPKAIKYYKFSLDRIVEYMLTGGIIIEIPKEDYEKFDIFKSKKEKYKAKSIDKMKKEELKKELEKQKEKERMEYEKRIDEEFRKQYFSDSDESEK